MPKIKKLSSEVIQKIAAGEIVERPGNIVKELVENALDADSSVISISVFDGGKTSIVVEDNGCGMSPEDAVLCFEHHATSKLEHFSDLEFVHTYGFRGEALSSICAVSSVTLTTKTKEEKEKTKVVAEGGIVKEISSCVGPIGTKIEITNLFSNIPARKKFLKKETTEMHHITQLFYAHCFQSLSVHFNLIKDNKTIFSCSPVLNLKDRYTQLEGFERSEKMKIIGQETKNNITISGIISDPMLYSYDRCDIFIFVNKRWVKNTGLSRAIINGYKNVLPSGKFPRAVLYITIDQTAIDINVSPKKEEVRFLHPKTVEQYIEEIVSKTLQQNFFIQEKQGIPIFDHILTSNTFSQNNMFPDSTPNQPYFLKEQVQKPITNVENNPSVLLEQNYEHEKQIAEIKIQQKIAIPDLICLGQFFNTYILAADHEKLYIIDQHAAHERIMFEKIAARNNQLLAVHLTFPLLITFKKEDLGFLLQATSIFAQCGILIEQFDETQLIITATPATISHHHIEKVMQETVVLLKEHTAFEKEEIRDKILYQTRAIIACKAAIKAGDVLEKITINQLMFDLSIINNRFCCPHGRPTMWEITTNELERKFKRKV